MRFHPPSTLLRALPSLALSIGMALSAGCSKDAPGTEPRVGSPESAAAELPRLFVFGVDGATWDVIGPLINEGRMPHFARLCQTGRYSRLATTKPNLSPILWTTIATGEPAEVHGIEGFTVPVPDSDEVTLPSSNLRKVPAFWNILSDAGQTVGVVNWWVSFPAEPINGFVISDRANFVRKTTYQEILNVKESGPESTAQEIYPRELYLGVAEHVHPSTEIDRALVERIVDLPDELFDELQAQEKFSRDNMLSVLKFALLQDQSMLAAALHALEAYEPEVMVFYTSGLDAAEHHFWKYHEPEKFKLPPDPDEVAIYGQVIRNYYVYVDDLLGEMLAAYGDEEIHVMIVSDHGHVAYEDYGTEHATGYGKIASGWHGYAPPGIFALSGPGIVPGNDLPGASIFDVAPTLLALRNVPVAEDVRGRVLEAAFAPTLLSERPVRTVPSYRHLQKAGSSAPVQSDADEELLEKLRALGYIE